jgi:putative transposase
MVAAELFRRRRLPHWDLPGAIYFVTTCLHGSIPAQGQLELRQLREKQRGQPRPEGMEAREWSVRQWKQVFVRSEEWLDERPAVRHFTDARLGEVVVRALFHFAGTRYDLLAYVVMPSHMHWAFRPRDEWVDTLGRGANDRPPRERIMHSVKLHTARECNRLLGRKGTFWQDESYDHCVLDYDELERIIDYIEFNPVKAGLVTEPAAWSLSSARARTERGTPKGHPLGPTGVGQVS